MIIVSTGTGGKVFHDICCHNVKKIKVSNRRYFNSSKAAAAQGYRKCNCCQRMEAYYKREEEEIKEYARKNKMVI